MILGQLEARLTRAKVVVSDGASEIREGSLIRVEALLLHTLLGSDITEDLQGKPKPKRSQVNTICHARWANWSYFTDWTSFIPYVRSLHFKVSSKRSAASSFRSRPDRAHAR